MLTIMNAHVFVVSVLFPFIVTHVLSLRYTSVLLFSIFVYIAFPLVIRHHRFPSLYIYMTYLESSTSESKSISGV
jgi:hypothetical protein